MAANPHFSPGIPLWLPVLIVLRDSIVVIGALLLNAFVGPVIIRVRLLGKLTTVVLNVTLMAALLALPLTAWLVTLSAIAILGSCAEYISDGTHQLKLLRAKHHGED